MDSVQGKIPDLAECNREVAECEKEFSLLVNELHGLSPRVMELEDENYWMGGDASESALRNLDWRLKKLLQKEAVLESVRCTLEKYVRPIFPLPGDKAECKKHPEIFHMEEDEEDEDEDMGYGWKADQGKDYSMKDYRMDEVRENQRWWKYLLKEDEVEREKKKMAIVQERLDHLKELEGEIEETKGEVHERKKELARLLEVNKELRMDENRFRLMDLRINVRDMEDKVEGKLQYNRRLQQLYEIRKKRGYPQRNPPIGDPDAND